MFRFAGRVDFSQLLPSLLSNSLRAIRVFVVAFEVFRTSQTVQQTKEAMHQPVQF